MPRLVRSVAVVVPRVLGQDLPEVLLANNQQVVEALAAQCSCESSRERVRPRRPDGSLDDPRAVPGEYLVEYRGELAVAVADQEFELAGAFAELHEQVAGLLGGPRPGGVCGDAQDAHAGSGSPSRTRRTGAGGTPCQRAGSRTTGSRAPGRPGTAAR